MKHSENINELATALVAFNSKQGPIHKSKKNPRFGGKYAPLEQVVDSTREQLFEHGLAILQGGATASAPDKICIETVLTHTSGQWMSFILECVPAKGEKGQGIQPSMESQPVIAAMTYLRRVSIGGILNLTIDDDDDGNSTTGQGQPREKKKSSSGGSSQASGASQQAGETGKGGSVVGQVDTVKVGTGTRANGDHWTRYGIKIRGDFYNTFSKTVGQAAQDASRNGATVAISWKPSGDEGQYRDVDNDVGLQILDPGAGVAEKPEPTGQFDDDGNPLPF